MKNLIIADALVLNTDMSHFNIKKHTAKTAVFLSLNGLIAAVLFALCVYPTWSYGGTMGYKPPMLWAAAVLLTLVTIRTRKAYKKPTFLISALILVYYAIPIFNNVPGMLISHLGNGAIQAHYYKPPIPWLPFSVRRPEAVEVFGWALGAVSIALACRHTLSRIAAKRLTWLLVANGTILAIIGILRTFTDLQILQFWDKGWFTFSTFGYPNSAAAFFLLLIPTAGPVLGALFLFCVVLTKSTIALALALFCVTTCAAIKFKRPSFFLLGALVALLIVPVVDKQMGENINIRANLTHRAVQVWRAGNIWIGAGPNGVGHATKRPDEIAQIERSGKVTRAHTEVHNEAAQLLAEHGIIGVALVLAGLAVFYRPRFYKSKFFIAVFCVGIYALGDIVFRTPAVLFYAVAVYSMAMLRDNNQTTGREKNEHTDNETV